MDFIMDFISQNIYVRSALIRVSSVHGSLLDVTTSLWTRKGSNQIKRWVHRTSRDMHSHVCIACDRHLSWSEKWLVKLSKTLYLKRCWYLQDMYVNSFYTHHLFVRASTSLWVSLNARDLIIPRHITFLLPWMPLYCVYPYYLYLR